MCDRNYEPSPIEVIGIPITLCVHSHQRPSPARIQVIEATLRLIPAGHLRVIAAGHIRLSHPNDTPRSGGGSDPAPWIRLSAVSLAAARVHSPTLLHEMGHVIDYHYGAMRTLRGTHPRLYNVLNSTAHTGRTQFDGERFADCYMIYFLTQVAGVGHVHRADPRAYQGNARDMRFSAMLSTPAFRDWAGPLSNLRVPPEVR
jgi:hypothetical protein